MPENSCSTHACHSTTEHDKGHSKQLGGQAHVHASLDVEQRLMTARQACQAQGIRFTPLREQVFKLILQAQTPIGAYDLLAQLQKSSDKAIAPPTVYRSLDFLLNQGFIHQLSSSKTFFPCCHPSDNTGHAHVAIFLICQRCGDVKELSHTPIDTVIHDIANASNFAIQSSVIELLGTCEQCVKSDKTK